MALWTHGFYPDNNSLEDHAQAHTWANEQEKIALKICEKCEFCKCVTFNICKISICEGVKAEMANDSTRAISYVLKENRCPKGRKW